MKTYLEYISENTEPLDEGVLSTIGKGALRAADIINSATYKVIPREILPPPAHDLHMGSFRVNKLDASNMGLHHVNPNFIPSHIVKISTGNSHPDTHIIGNELGKNGPQVYRKNANGTYTNISSFRLMHEHPDLARTQIGHEIHSANKEAFKTLPITASSGDIRRVMAMNPNDTHHGLPVSTLQKLALNHPSSSQANVGHLLSNPNVNQMILKHALIRHGMTKEHANNIMSLPNVTHTDIIDAARNRLTQP